jgi:hypothetical protein
MGYGSYSSSTRMLRSSSLGYDTKSATEIFSRNINNAMSPDGITERESRDSTEHPNSVPIILALDVTGSMGSLPHYLVKEGLPHMMDKIIQGGVPDPQVLFMGIGDHECDRAPLQVGQFESGDELLDHWLTKLFIEGGGGGNMGESYLLAWYFASKYVKADHFEKRKKKGLLFTVGDEPTLTKIPAKALESIMGKGREYKAVEVEDVLKAAQKHFACYHIHMLQGSNGNSKDVQNHWTKLLGDNVLMVQRKEEVAQVIADTVVKVASVDAPATGDGRFEGVA